MEGLVLGKFMPLTNGHIALIDFALEHCDTLNVLVCINLDEPIAGQLRIVWVRDYYANNPRVNVRWTTESLPSSSVSDRGISKTWATYLKSLFSNVDIFFASEQYAEYVAEYMCIDYKIFDIDRKIIPISATMVRDNPFKYWDYIPNIVRPYFVKRICIYGSESCGKSVLAKRLARHFDTSYVPEMARYVGEFANIDWTKCSKVIFEAFAKSHRDMINTMSMLSNRFLFVDSDNLTTQIYADKYIGLGNKSIKQYDTIKYDMYFLMKPDCEFVQDGTRRYENQRWRMHRLFKEELIKRNIEFYEIGDDWDERYQECIKIIHNERAKK